LRHRRGELDLLRTTKSRGHAQVGGSHARRLRILGEALPEVHASGYVQAGAVAKSLEVRRPAHVRRAAGTPDAGGVGEAEPGGPRRVSPRYQTVCPEEKD